MIRVLVADDHRLVRQGLMALLASASDIQVVGEARDGQEAVELTEQLAPDVVLMDISMPRLDGLKATALIRTRRNQTKVLIVSMNCDETLLTQAERSGAKGYLSKNCAREELHASIRAIQSGHLCFPEQNATGN